MPERFVPNAIWGFRQAIARDGTQNITLSKMTNAYGAAGNLQRGVEDNTQEVANTLGARLKSTEDIDEQRLMLVAFGNVGDLSRSLPHTERFFRSEHAILRARAFDSFLRAEGDDAVFKFAEKYRTERDMEVRRSAIQILLEMSPSAARSDLGRELLGQEQDHTITSRLITLVGHDVIDNSDKESEKTLRELLGRTKDRILRKEVYNYIKPTAGGAR